MEPIIRKFASKNSAIIDLPYSRYLYAMTERQLHLGDFHMKQFLCLKIVLNRRMLSREAQRIL